VSLKGSLVEKSPLSPLYKRGGLVQIHFHTLSCRSGY
jgi:hypothetical protein